MRGKGVLITGASKGLGAALAEELAAAGARVVLVARGEEELGKTVARIRDRGGEEERVEPPFDFSWTPAPAGLVG